MTEWIDWAVASVVFMTQVIKEERRAFDDNLKLDEKNGIISMEDDLFVNEAHDETSQRRQSEWENTIAQDAY